MLPLRLASSSFSLADSFSLAGSLSLAAVAGFGAEGQAAALAVPGQGGDGALAWPPQQNLLLIGEPGGKHHAVGIADGDDFVRRMTGNACHHHVASRTEFQRSLAHRAVLAGKGPDNGRRRAGTREPASLGAPGHRFDLGRIAAHSHMLAVG